MKIRTEITAVTLTKVEHIEKDKYSWGHKNEQDHVRTAAKALEKTANRLNKYLRNSSCSDFRLGIEKIIYSNILTINLVLFADQDDEDTELFSNQADAFAKEIKVILKDARAAINQTVEIGGTNPNRISIVGGGKANIKGAVATTSLAADVANAIRSCAHDVNGLQLTLKIDGQDHELNYVDSSAAFLDDKNIKKSRGVTKSLCSVRSMAGLKPDGTQFVEIAFIKEHRKALANSWFSHKPISFLWVSKIKYRNGEPIIVGGQIVEITEPLELDLKIKN